MVQKRDILMSVILTIVTCGIYGLFFWMPKIDEDTKKLAGENTAEGLSGIVLSLVTWITCGIYGIYWAYQTGIKLGKINGTESDNSIVYAIISFFCPIVTWGLVQNELNKHAAE